MPASKKDLKKAEQKKNVEKGIGDAKGRIPSRQKAEAVMGTCAICKQQIKMIKNNIQAKAHVDSKHSGKSFGDCFPGFE